MSHFPQDPNDRVICPKCRHVRPLDATVPAWQCPACGVAYAKASQAAAAIHAGPAAVADTASAAAARSRSSRSGPRWFGLFLALFMAYAVWTGVQAGLGHRGGLSSSELRALAATVKSDDVVMYSTQGCGYCVQAKRWLANHGFAFTECDIERSTQCLREFEAEGADGTPYLKVRGQPMRNGFHVDEFVGLLRR